MRFSTRFVLHRLHRSLLATAGKTGFSRAGQIGPNLNCTVLVAKFSLDRAQVPQNPKEQLVGQARVYRPPKQIAGPLGFLSGHPSVLVPRDEGHIPEHVEPGEQRRTLKHNANIIDSTQSSPVPSGDEPDERTLDSEVEALLMRRLKGRRKY